MRMLTIKQKHSCPCGCVLDRDVAAAKVILQRAGIGPYRLNAVECDKRADGKIHSPELLIAGK